MRVEQAELDRISDTIAGGQRVDGWSGERYADIHVVRRLAPDELWVRRVPDGKWVQVPGMGP